MPRVRFTDDYDWKPTPLQTHAYKAGWEGLVTTPCAAAAIDAGKAVRVGKPKASDDSEADEDGNDGQ